MEITDTAVETVYYNLVDWRRKPSVSKEDALNMINLVQSLCKKDDMTWKDLCKLMLRVTNMSTRHESIVCAILSVEPGHIQHYIGLRDICKAIIKCYDNKDFETLGRLEVVLDVYEEIKDTRV